MLAQKILAPGIQGLCLITPVWHIVKYRITLALKHMINGTQPLVLLIC